MRQDELEGVFRERKYGAKWPRGKRTHCTFKETMNSNDQSVASESGSMWGERLLERQAGTIL